MIKRSRTPLANFLEEAKAIVEEAERRNITLRLMGAVAIRIHCPKFSYLHEALEREFTDLDFMAYSKDLRKVKELFCELGYQERRMGAAIAISAYGERLIFDDLINKRHVDVFFDKLRMCHTIDFRGRLELDYPTITPTDLLLEKLQIVKINEKDIKDVIVLLREHEIGEKEKETINVRYIARLLSSDWGFYYTVTTNLSKIKTFLDHYGVLREDDRKNVTSKINKIQKIIEEEPKSLKWKLRAKIGTRIKWYEEVEEVVRGPQIQVIKQKPPKTLMNTKFKARV